MDGTGEGEATREGRRVEARGRREGRKKKVEEEGVIYARGRIMKRLNKVKTMDCECNSF